MSDQETPKINPDVAKDGQVYEFKDHKVFDVVISNSLHEVWQRRERHQDGSDNGCIDNWWVKLVRGHGEYEWVPYLNGYVNRPAWDISIKIGNTFKDKGYRTSIRKSGEVIIKCNLRTVYRFHCGDLDYAMNQARSIIYKMEEHPFCFWESEKEIGRKVYYHNQPAVVSRLYLDEGEIFLQYDGDKEGFDMIRPWDKHSDWPQSEWHGEKTVRENILCEHIWWFRE